MLIVWMIIDEVKSAKKPKEEKENKIPEDKTKVLSASERRKLEEQEENKVE